MGLFVFQSVGGWTPTSFPKASKASRTPSPDSADSAILPRQHVALTRQECSLRSTRSSNPTKIQRRHCPASPRALEISEEEQAVVASTPFL